MRTTNAGRSLSIATSRFPGLMPGLTLFFLEITLVASKLARVTWPLVRKYNHKPKFVNILSIFFICSLIVCTNL